MYAASVSAIVLSYSLRDAICRAAAVASSATHADATPAVATAEAVGGGGSLWILSVKHITLRARDSLIRERRSVRIRRSFWILFFSSSCERAQTRVSAASHAL